MRRENRTVTFPESCLEGRGDCLGAQWHLSISGPQGNHGTPLIDDDFLVLVNSWWEPLDFVLPDTRTQARWRVEIDSYDPAAPAGAVTRGAGDQVTVGPRSVAVLRAALLR